MCAWHDHEGTELRALLREARGDRRQADIAAAAGVSVGLYKRLESGRRQTIRLTTLLRVADALRLSTAKRAKLVALARPDLTRMIEAQSAAAGPLLSLVRRLAIQLGRVHGRGAALRTAVELLHASVARDGMSFAFETRGPRGMRTGYSVGVDLWRRAFPPQFLQATANFGPETMRIAGSGVRTMYIGIRENADVLVVLGFASTADRDFDPKQAEMLEVIAAILELRLSGRAVLARP